MRNYKTILFLLSIMFIAASCKKYDDGPYFSLRGKNARLAGKWNTQYWMIDKYEQKLILDYGRTAEFTKDGIYRFHETDPYIHLETNLEGTWEWREDKEQIILGLPTGADSAMNYEIWDVLRLKNDELWLEMVVYNYPFSVIYEWRLTQE